MCSQAIYISCRIYAFGYDLESDCAVLDATGIRSTAVIEPQLKGIFGDVGKFLSQYRSGKLPKPFRSIPKIRNWEDVSIQLDQDYVLYSHMQSLERPY